MVTSCNLPRDASDGAAGSPAGSPQVVGGTSTRADGDAARPYRDLRKILVDYSGPGREEAAPENLTEVRVGWFGPGGSGDPLDGGLWLAAQMALEETGGTLGPGGLPVRLLPAWSSNPWGTGVRGVTRLVYGEGVWALAGAPDGAAAHLVEQVTAKARVAFLSSISTDKTTNLTNVPWIFSCAPADDEIARILAGSVAGHAAGRPFALVSSTAHDARLLVDEMLGALQSHGCQPRFHLQFRAGDASFATQLASLTREPFACLVLIADPGDSVRFLTAARAAGIEQRVFAGPAMGRSLVREAPVEALGDLVYPELWDRTGEEARAFSHRFVERTGREPDFAEAYAHDSVRMLLDALRDAGLNRVRIRDSVRALSPWHGVTGTVRWDPTGRNVGARVGLATYRQGRIVRLEEALENAGDR